MPRGTLQCHAIPSIRPFDSWVAGSALVHPTFPLMICMLTGSFDHGLELLLLEAASCQRARIDASHVLLFASWRVPVLQSSYATWGTPPAPDYVTFGKPITIAERHGDWRYTLSAFEALHAAASVRRCSLSRGVHPRALTVRSDNRLYQIGPHGRVAQRSRMALARSFVRSMTSEHPRRPSMPVASGDA